MSMKNRVLLHRTGRDQFGNKGEPPLPEYVPSDEENKRTDQMRKLHIELNEAFIDEYGDKWLSLFEGMSKKAIWLFLYPNKKPALGTFYNHARVYATLKEYLSYLLVQNKYWSLSKLGYDRNQVRDILKPFSECGRYYVSYKGGASFGTSI